MHEELALRCIIAVKETELATVSGSCGTNFTSISAHESFTEDSCLDKTETAENGHESNIAVSVLSMPENAVNLVHDRKFSAPMRDSRPLTEADEPTDWKNISKSDNGACRQEATSQPSWMPNKF